MSVLTERDIHRTIASSNERVLPQGTSFVHLSPTRPELGLGTDPKRDAARNQATIGKNRKSGHLRNEFFQDTPGGTRLYGGSDLSDGGAVRLVGQPAGYFEMSGLTVATDDLVGLHSADEDELVPTMLSSDLSSDTRIAYRAAMMAGLQTAHQWATADQQSIVIEHATPEVSQPHCKYPRSVPLPHASFGNVDLASIKPEKKAYPHLVAEQEFLEGNPDYTMLLALYLYGYLNGFLQESEFDREALEIRQRKVEPYGYEIAFDITPDRLSDPRAVQLVSTVLDAQHQVYEKVSKLLDPQAITHGGEIYSFKQQPASRDLMYIGGDSNLTVVRSPILYSHAGGMESSGLNLKRSPDVNSLYAPETIRDFRADAGLNFERTIYSLYDSTLSLGM
jgi:hypothetical protein